MTAAEKPSFARLAVTSTAQDLDGWSELLAISHISPAQIEKKIRVPNIKYIVFGIPLDNLLADRVIHYSGLSLHGWRQTGVARSTTLR
jgi:hypothetical protein